MPATNNSQIFQPSCWESCHAIRAPIAPTAPKARYSTPVARYRTTMPTPDRAYTPPRDRPVIRNCSRSVVLGIDLFGRPNRGVVAAAYSLAGRRIGRRRRARRGSVLGDLWIVRGDVEASLGRHHLPVVRGRGEVRVVGDVQRVVPVHPGLAEQLGLLVL